MTDTEKEVKLHTTMDAQAWAKEFVRLNPTADEGLMLTWFANAIMCGWDHAHWKLAPHSPTPPPVSDEAGLEEHLQSAKVSDRAWIRAAFAHERAKAEKLVDALKFAHQAIENQISLRPNPVPSLTVAELRILSALTAYRSGK